MAQSMGVDIVAPIGTKAGAVRQATTGHAPAGGLGPDPGSDVFTAAVADHHRELARFVFRLCGDRNQAEDVVAEAYARVWSRWRRSRVDALLPCLMRAVANEA